MPSPGTLGAHLGGSGWDIVTLVALSAVAVTLLCGLALVAYRRRGSRAYLLVVLALGALLARPLIALLSGFSMVSRSTHHLLEHGLDTLFVVLIFAAVYYARTVEKQFDGEEL